MTGIELIPGSVKAATKLHLFPWLPKPKKLFQN